MCESCGAPVDSFAGLNFCQFCSAPLTFARRKAANRTRGKLTDVFQQGPPSPRPVAGATSPRGAAAASSSPRGAPKATPPSRAAPCSSCKAELMPNAVFCTKCGTNVAKATAQFCAVCGGGKVAGKTAAATLVCPKCEPEAAGPVKLPRDSMVVDIETTRTAGMKLHLMQGTLLNVAAAEHAPVKSIKWAQLMLEREIGSGAYSTVYAAKYHQNIAVAVKLLQMDSSSENVADFKLEVAVLASLSHASIVKFHGAVFDEEKLAYVLEYCANGSLSYLLVRDDVEMLWERRINWAKQVAEGLAYLHTKRPKIIHRDLKSDNLFVTANWQIKIGDFGLCKAKSLSQELAKAQAGRGEKHMGLNRMLSSRASVVAFSSAAGTPAYMAPELFRTGAMCSEKIDVYAFGIVLSELVSREWAFAQTDEDHIKELVLAGERPELPEWTPPELVKLIRQCVDADASKRPGQTLLAMLKALPHGTWREPPNTNSPA